MKKLLVLLVVLVLLSTTGSVFGMISTTELKSRINSPEGTQAKDQITQLIIKHFGNERLILNFLEDNKSLSIVMEDAKVVNITETKIDGTVEINVKSISFFEKLTNEEVSFKQAFKDGDISFKGLTFWNKVKFGLLNLILKISLR